MKFAFEDAEVSDAQVRARMAAVPSIVPEHDRHVVAAALAGRAEVIVTANIRHFSGPDLAELGILVEGPDDFLVDQWYLSAPAVADGVGSPAGVSIQSVFRGLVEDEDRTRLICADVAAAVRAGRNCLILSQWTEHIARFKTLLEERGLAVDLLQGGIGKKARHLITDRLAAARSGDGVVLLATGSFLGEGFDCPPLDTLFLAFPIAFKGRLVQYVGRVLRPIDGKARVEVHDYVDARVPVLARMHAKRLVAYASLGFDVGRGRSTRS